MKPRDSFTRFLILLVLKMGRIGRLIRRVERSGAPVGRRGEPNNTCTLNDTFRS
jgi:hypothetical protein